MCLHASHPLWLSTQVFFYLASLRLHLFHCSLLGCSRASCFLYLSFHCHFLLLYLSIPTSLSLCICFLLSLCLSLWASQTLVRSSKHHPNALFLCIFMRWWALNNTHSQQTFKRARLASYMLGWCAALLLVGCSCFLMQRERKPEQREVWLFHEVGLILLLCGRVESVRYTPSCCCALLHSLALCRFRLPAILFFFFLLCCSSPCSPFPFFLCKWTHESMGKARGSSPPPKS